MLHLDGQILAPPSYVSRPPNFRPVLFSDPIFNAFKLRRLVHLHTDQLPSLSYHKYQEKLTSLGWAAGESSPPWSPISLANAKLSCNSALNSPLQSKVNSPGGMCSNSVLYPVTLLKIRTNSRGVIQARYPTTLFPGGF